MFRFLAEASWCFLKKNTSFSITETIYPQKLQGPLDLVGSFGLYVRPTSQDIMVGVAQSVESRIVIPVVVGSSPIVHPAKALLILTSQKGFVGLEECLGPTWVPFESTHQPNHLGARIVQGIDMASVILGWHPVHVALCGRDIGVARPALDLHDGSSCHGQVSTECVPQSVPSKARGPLALVLREPWFRESTHQSTVCLLSRAVGVLRGIRLVRC